MSSKIISFEEHTQDKKVSARDSRYYCLKVRQDEMEATLDEMQDAFLTILRSGCIPLDEKSPHKELNA